MSDLATANVVRSLAGRVAPNEARDGRTRVLAFFRFILAGVFFRHFNGLLSGLAVRKQRLM